jgi:glycosyltransferase involved in cell wall biosynthesis
MNEPLVSCIMPTRNRRPFIWAAIDNFLRQTYPNKELIIFNDGRPVCDLLPYPADKRILYHSMPARIDIGSARNLCCEIAKGEIICHADDDDWSASDRIVHQVDVLTKSTLPITGFGTLLFWDAVAKQAKIYRTSVPGYVCGTSLCYLRGFWRGHQFASIEVNEDNRFVYQHLPLIKPSSEMHFMVARIHSGNTSPKDGISEIVSRDLIPKAFWANEAMIQNASL